MSILNNTIEKIIRQYLSYQDIEEPLAVKEERYAAALSRTTTLDYAKALQKLAKKYGEQRIHNTANRLRDQFEQRINILQIIPSPFGQSHSWIYWDLAKQYYLFQNPQKSDINRYRLADPIIDEALQEEIVFRHLGWELHHFKEHQSNRRSSAEYYKLGKRTWEKR